MDQSAVRVRIHTRSQGLGILREGQAKPTSKCLCCKTRQRNSALKRRKQALRPVEGENPLTGMELGTSLRLYSVLLARAFWPRSSHTEWEEERRFTKDTKDCGDREIRSSSVLLHVMHSTVPAKPMPRVDRWQLPVASDQHIQQAFQTKTKADGHQQHLIQLC